MSNTTIFKKNKRTLRDFMQSAYTDERLAWLLAHARAGKLAYNSCCCFIGIPTANHQLQDTLDYLDAIKWQCKVLKSDGVVPLIGVHAPHFKLARQQYGALRAEGAFAALAGNFGSDGKRQRILIPMVLAEIRRRDRLSASLSSHIQTEIVGIVNHEHQTQEHAHV